MRKFEVTYEAYAKLRSQLNKECIDFIKKVATAWKGKKFPLMTINREFDAECALCCIIYDGGNHPEYASNVCSEVENVYLDKTGDLVVDTEDCAGYDIYRVEYSDLETIAFALSETIDFMIEELIQLIGGTSKEKEGKWTISRETWDRLVDLAEGRDDIIHYLDEDSGEDTINDFVECYYPKGYVELIKEVAEIGENEVTWTWK